MAFRSVTMIDRRESFESNVQCGQASTRSHQPPAEFASVFLATQSLNQGLPNTSTNTSAAMVPAPGADLYRLPRAMARYFPNGQPTSNDVHRYLSLLQVVDELGSQEWFLVAVSV